MISNKNLLIIAAICFVLGTATRIINNLPPSNPYALSEQEKAQLGRPSPNFAFTGMDGKTRMLSDFAGKAVILNFWATWCAPCVVEFPQMLNLAEIVGDDVVFIFLSSDLEKEPIRRFMERQAQTHAHALARDNVLIAHDASKAVTQTLFQSYRLPETYLLAPDHTIADKIVGASVVWDAPEMIGKIFALAQKPQ